MEAAFQSGFASALLDVVFNKVTDFIVIELRKIKDADKVLGKLQTTLADVGKVLLQIDTSVLQGSDGNDLLRQVEELTNLFYESEDLIECIALDIVDHYTCHKPVRRTILSSPTSLFKPHAIVKLQGKLEAALKELKAQFDTSRSTPISHQSNGGVKLDMKMIKPLRKDETKAIVQKLISPTSEYQGVSILGGHGLGKTSVALTVQHQPSVAEYFSSTFWVDVGGRFEAGQVIDHLDRQAKESSSNSGASCRGQQRLLIILDNMLEVTSPDWIAFWSRIISVGINGICDADIRILITTSNPKVTTISHTSSHHLNPLSDADCRELIIHTGKLFSKALSNSDCQKAVSLTQKCGGFPSVAIILGAFFARPPMGRSDHHLDMNFWDSELFRDEVTPVLMSFYSQVEPHLKRCLAYFSLFPRDYIFTSDDLVQLWVGEGFILERGGTLQSLETAKKCFDHLLGMSILRRSDDMVRNGFPAYELNPFSHKFSQMTASRTCLQLDQGTSTSSPQNQNANAPVFSKYTRHLSFKSLHQLPWKDIKKLKGLRTCLSLSLHRNRHEQKIDQSAFKNLTSLRVLSLSQASITDLPDSVKYLKLLHCLDISHTRIRRLPETLSELRSLEFLRLIKDQEWLECLPQKFQNLTNMIYIDWTVSDITHMGLPSHIGALSNLQTLPLFPVGKRGHAITELKCLNDLQGSIRISNLENVRDLFEAKNAKLWEKLLLEKVELLWTSPGDERRAREILSGLKPSSNLKQLKVTNFGGSEFPEWVVHSTPGHELHLKNLEELHLKNCNGLTILPQFGQLCNLKSLILEEINKVATFGCSNNQENTYCAPIAQPGHFLKLESLMFKDMGLLDTVKVGLEGSDMPRLRVLNFTNCPKLANVSSLSHLTSLKELLVELCQELGSLPHLPSSLESLTIRDSKLLSDWCNDRGANWSKIGCIENVEIDYVKIPMTGSNYVLASHNQQDGNSSNQQNGR